MDYTLDGRHRWGPTIDHLDPITLGGDEVPPPELLAPAHRHCNTSHGAKLGNRLRGQRRTATKPAQATNGQGAPRVPESPENVSEVPPRPYKRHPAVSSPQTPAPEPQKSREPSPSAITPPGTPRIAADLAALPWLAPLFPIPPDATWPRHITAPHPAATGSYGVRGIEWIHRRREADPRVPARAKRLRWWQQLVLLRQWEHDADGQLVWPEALLTVSRQVGKSVGLAERSIARTVLFPQWAGEPQLVMQVSKDLAAAREVQRLVRMWAAEQDGMKVRGTHGQEEIELPDGSRYMIRGRDSVYSYSVGAAELDEAWGVRPDVVDDGIEPTMAERELPQLSLTSTAHPRATPLFPSRRAAALRGLDAPVRNTPLLLEWSAAAELDPDDQAAWRAASPHWDRRRADVLERAHRRWADGRQDEETVAAGGFEYQWLNRWNRPEADVPAGRMDPSVWASAARPGVAPLPARRVVAVGHDRVSGAWAVCWAGRDAEGVVVAGAVSTHGGLDAARADAERAVSGGGGVLLLPSALRGYVRVRGCRGGPVLLRESDVASSWEILQWRLGAGAVLHPGDRAMDAAVLAVPLLRRPGVWDAGVLLVCALWWAGRDDTPRTAVV